MPSASFHVDTNGLGKTRRRDFNGNTTWPPNRASLRALVDLGLSDDRIAKYFRVSQADVAGLCQVYELTRSQLTRT